MMIQTRLAGRIHKFIKTQYGFRKGKSTTHALYIARRIQDLAAQNGDNIVLVLLDWEEAFDKIDQTRMNLIK